MRPLAASFKPVCHKETGRRFSKGKPLPEKKLAERNKAVKTTCQNKGILLVDDQSAIRKIVSDMLCTLGYEVFAAPSGPEALQLFSAHTQQIQLAIIDLSMPEMNGQETFRALRRIRPDLKAVLSSGYIIDDGVRMIIDEGMQGFLQKPFRLSELARTVAHALNAS